MTAEGFKRKLTVVFSADVVGYSRLMEEDEAATVRSLEEYKGVMFTLIKQHRGRVIDSPGDNLLADFLVRRLSPPTGKRIAATNGQCLRGWCREYFPNWQTTDECPGSRFL